MWPVLRIPRLGAHGSLKHRNGQAVQAALVIDPAPGYRRRSPPEASPLWRAAPDRARGPDRPPSHTTTMPGCWRPRRDWVDLQSLFVSLLGAVRLAPIRVETSQCGPDAAWPGFSFGPTSNSAIPRSRAFFLNVQGSQHLIAGRILRVKFEGPLEGGFGWLVLSQCGVSLAEKEIKRGGLIENVGRQRRRRLGRGDPARYPCLSRN